MQRDVIGYKVGPKLRLRNNANESKFLQNSCASFVLVQVL